MSCAAPHSGGGWFQLPAWMMLVLLRARPTWMFQFTWDVASIEGFHVPEAMGWPSLG
jgi:hypothetical protein